MDPWLKRGRKAEPTPKALRGKGGCYRTCRVLNNALYQHGVLGYALSDQQNALLHAKPPHDGKVADFL